MMAPKIELEVLAEVLEASKQRHKQVFTQLKDAVDKTIEDHDAIPLLPDYVQRLRQLQGVIWH
jgi:hypothetical protein